MNSVAPFMAGLMMCTGNMFAEMLNLYYLQSFKTVDKCIRRFVLLKFVNEFPRIYYESLSD